MTDQQFSALMSMLENILELLEYIQSSLSNIDINTS